MGSATYSRLPRLSLIHIFLIAAGAVDLPGEVQPLHPQALKGGAQLPAVDAVIFNGIGQAEMCIRDSFGAYILVLDGRGQLMSNLKAAYVQDPAFVTSLNQKELNQALNEVLGGEEISVRTMVDGAPTFTVGVPFVQNNQVLGAVPVSYTHLDVYKRQR